MFNCNKNNIYIIFVFAIVIFCYIVFLADSYSLSTHEIDIFPTVDLSGEMAKNSLLESNGIFYTLLFRKLYKFIPHSDLGIRSLSIFFGILSIFATYGLANSIVKFSEGTLSKSLPFFSTFLLIINCEFMKLSFHNRFYAMAVLLCTLATWCFIELCRKFNIWKFVLYLSLLICSMCTMVLTAVSVIPCICFYLYNAPKNWRRWLVCSIILATISSVFAFLVVRDSTAIQRFNYHDYKINSLLFFVRNGFSTYEQVHPNLRPFIYEDSGRLNEKANHNFALIEVIMTIVILSSIFSIIAKKEKKEVSVFSLVMILFVIGLYIFYSIKLKNIINHNNFALLLPIFCIFLAQGLTKNIRILFFACIAISIPYTHTSMIAHENGSKKIFLSAMRHMRIEDNILVDNDDSMVLHYISQGTPHKKNKVYVNKYNILNYIDCSNLAMINCSADSNDKSCCELSEIIREFLLCLQRIRDYPRQKPQRLWIFLSQNTPETKIQINKIFSWLKESASKYSLRYLIGEEDGIVIMIRFPETEEIRYCKYLSNE